AKLDINTQKSLAYYESIADTIKKENYIGSWNEIKTTDFSDDIAFHDPEEGDLGGPITLALALERKVGDKDQRIMILGDADCFSNGETSRFRKNIRAKNFDMAMGMFFWLSNNEVPIDVRRPAAPDDEIYTTEKTLGFLRVFYKIIAPLLLGLAGLLIWFRRKGR
ncbi:hypothetical protein L3073_16880, partial [Ancylomarina sp. DW003]